MTLRKAHAKYSASAAYRYFKCPASVRLAETVPERPSSPSALDGTEAHSLLEFCLMGGIDDVSAAVKLDAFKHFEYRKDSIETRTMAVQDAVDHVRFVLHMHRDAELFLETGFDFPTKVVPGEAYGTADIVVVSRAARTVWVIDYKHGLHPVEAEGNPQLLFYANGVLELFDPDNSLFDVVNMTIVQPRAAHPKGLIREEHMYTFEAREFVEVFDKRVAATLKPDAPFVPDDDACKFCPASVVCPAIAARVLSIAGTQFKTVRDVTQYKLPDAAALSPEQIAFALTTKTLMLNWFARIEEHAADLAHSGAYIPDYKLVEAQAKRRWDGNDIDIAGMLMLYLSTTDEDTVRPRALIPLTKAEEMLKLHFRSTFGMKGRGGANKASEAASRVIAELTIKESSGKLSLVHTSDNRPAVDKIRRDFQNVQPFKIIDGIANRI